MLNCINTDFTKYFSWGDIRGDNKNGYGSYSFSSGNYNAGASGSGHTLTGDIPQGNIYYDAATANMGSPWKMFTQAQGQELIDKTKHTWTTINGVNGRKFTSKTDSSKYIFLPAGGHWSEDTHSHFRVQAWYYSTSSAKYSGTYPKFIYFDSYNIEIQSTSYRKFGCSVRAIQ